MSDHHHSKASSSFIDSINPTSNHNFNQILIYALAPQSTQELFPYSNYDLLHQQQIEQWKRYKQEQQKTKQEQTNNQQTNHQRTNQSTMIINKDNINNRQQTTSNQIKQEGRNRTYVNNPSNQITQYQQVNTCSNKQSPNMIFVIVANC